MGKEMSDYQDVAAHLLVKVTETVCLQEKVLPELYELLRDEELTVQNAAFASLVQMLDYLPPEIRQTKIMPFLRLCAPELTELILAAELKIHSNSKNLELFP